MPGNPNFTHEIFSSRIKIPATEHVGQAGRIFYHEDTGELRISDGVTPHGHPIFASGGGGTGVELKFYVESGAPITPPQAVAGSIALGDGSQSRVIGSLTQASGRFTTSGDAQLGSYIARTITTNNVQTEMFLDGLAQRLLIASNMSVSFIVNVIARRTDSYNNEGAVYELRGGIDRGATEASTSLIGIPSEVIVSSDNPVWQVKVFADTTNGALVIRVKGENGKNIRWVAHIQTIEVMN